MGRHQKYLRIFLSFVLSVSPIIFINNANAAIGGWTLGNPVAQGASAVYDATKTVLINGKDVVKNSVVKITPTATDVAKVLARGGATLALTIAVEQLLGAVDWVLDPANNQIVYTKPQECNLNNCSPTVQYIYEFAGRYPGVYFSSIQEACAFYDLNDGNAWYGPVYAEGQKCRSAQIATVEVPSIYHNPAYDPNAEEEEQKTLPLETVAAQVISNAESETEHKVGAQTATLAAAADIVNEAESDDTKARPIATQLDQAASTATDESATGTSTTTKTDPVTGEPVTETTQTEFTWVKACEWAPSFCEAAQTIISFPQTLTNWWDTAVTAVTTTYAEAKEWATSESQTETNLDIDVQDDSAPNTDISFSTSCPAKIPLQFNWNGQSLDFSFDFTMWCQAISTYVYPIVVTLGSLHALYIVTGVRQDG